MPKTLKLVNPDSVKKDSTNDLDQLIEITETIEKKDVVPVRFLLERINYLNEQIDSLERQRDGIQEQIDSCVSQFSLKINQEGLNGTQGIVSGERGISDPVGSDSSEVAGG